MNLKKLKILSHKLTICRLESGDQIPSWVFLSQFYTIQKTEDELSIVCEEHLVPNDLKRESDWLAIKVIGPLDFALTGILSSLALPLAQAKISIFAISTFDTDYLLVKSGVITTAQKVLSEAGFVFVK